MAQTTNQQLAIIVLATDGAQALRRLAEQATNAGCNLIEARETPLGDRTAIALLADGSWDAIVRLEQALERLGTQLQASVVGERVQPTLAAADRIPYAVDVSCADKPGVLSALIEFFTERDVVIMELTARSYQTTHTGAWVFTVQMNVGLPQDMHIAGIREEFMDFCDGLNLDAILEPIKG